MTERGEKTRFTFPYVNSVNSTGYFGSIEVWAHTPEEAYEEMVDQFLSRVVLGQTDVDNVVDLVSIVRTFLAKLKEMRHPT